MQVDVVAVGQLLVVSPSTGDEVTVNRTTHIYGILVALHRLESVARDVVVGGLAVGVRVGNVGEVALGADHVEFPEEFLLGRLLDGPLRDGRIASQVLKFLK